MNPLQPRRGDAWRKEATSYLHRLEDDAGPRYDGQSIAPYGSSVSEHTPGCFRPDKLDIVRHPFVFGSDERFVVVRLQRVAMVRFMRALRDEPRMQVGFGSPALTATYRDCELQRILWENYQDGGPLAAPPGQSWHNRALSLDLGKRDDDERDAMLHHGFFDLLPQDPPHFTYGRKG